MSNTKQQNPPDPVEMLYIESPSISLKQFREAIDRLVIEAKIKGINEAHKEILEMAYAYTGEDELSDFCGVDDLSRVAMSWKVSRIKELKNNTTKQEDIKLVEIQHWKR